jgi:DNA-binding LacI/PurR family transcriptional regulator
MKKARGGQKTSVQDGRAVTMQDVAQRVGVTSMTVSRVLNGTGRISPQMRQKVQAAIDELGYRPHLAPRMMKSRKSWQVGVLLENRPERRYTHPLAWEFVLGINEGLEQGGHMMSLMRLTDVAQDGGLQARALQSQLLDGVIVVNYLPGEIEERLEQMLPRCIWLDADVWRDERCIRRAEVQAGEDAVQGLVEQGYRRLLFLHGSENPSNHFSFAQRIAGVRGAATRARVLLDEFVLHNETVRDAFPRLRALLRPDTGLVVVDSYAVQMLMQCLASSPLKLGKDFALACCDAHFHEAVYGWQNIAHVDFDRFEMGRQAAQMMLQVLHAPHEPCPSRLLRGQWQAGETARKLPLRKGQK